MARYGGLLEHRGPGQYLDYYNLRLMLKILYAGCLGLHPVISAQYTLAIYIIAWNHEKSSFNPLFFRVHDHSKVIDVDTLGKLVISASYDKQQVGAYLQPFSG